MIPIYQNTNVSRLLQAGYPVEQVARLTGYPIPEINRYRGFLTSGGSQYWGMDYNMLDTNSPLFSGWADMVANDRLYGRNIDDYASWWNQYSRAPAGMQGEGWDAYAQGVGPAVIGGPNPSWYVDPNVVTASSPTIIDTVTGDGNANGTTTTGTQGTTTTTGGAGSGATVEGAGGNTAPGAGTAGAGGTAGTVGAQNEAPVPQRYVPGSANLFRGGGMFGNWTANDPRAAGNINRSGGANINRTAYTPLQIRRGLFS